MEEKRCDLCGGILINGEYDWITISEISNVNYTPSGDNIILSTIYRHTHGNCESNNDDLCAIGDAYVFDK